MASVRPPCLSPRTRWLAMFELSPKILRNIFVIKRLQFNCPGCNLQLTADISEIGCKSNCPSCNVAFMTPGGTELAEFRIREAEDALARSDRANKRKQEIAEERAANSEKKRSEAALKDRSEQIVGNSPTARQTDAAAKEVLADGTPQSESNDKGKTAPNSLLGLVGCLGIIVFICCGGPLMISSFDKSKSVTYLGFGSTNSEPSLAGLTAADVHGNFTSRGFTLTTRLDPVQSEWKCTDTNGNRMMLVETFGNSATFITMVRGTYVSYGTSVDRSDASQFLGFVASIPYSSATPTAARAWVENNVGQNVTSTFGSARFELIANPNTPSVRMLIITP